MLKIRTEQLFAFKQAMQETAYQKLEERLRARCPELTEPLSSAALQAHIRAGMKRAPAYDLFEPAQAERFVVFRLRFGADFERLAWVGNILAQPFKSAELRLSELEAHAKTLGGSGPCRN